MKVALVYPIPFGDAGSYGGGERYAWELARALSEVVPTTFVTTAARRARQRIGSLQVEMYPWLTLLRGHRINPLCLRYIKSLADADVIHCLSYSTLLTDLSVLFSRVASRRVFITDVGGGGDLTLSKYVDVAGMADGLLVLSDYARRSFAKHGHAAQVIYGGVDINRFFPPSEHLFRERKVVCVGRILPHKGINYVIDALPSELSLVVVGRVYHAQYFAYLKDISAGKNVTFLTNATDEEVAQQYRTCSAAVQASVYRTVFDRETEVPELLGLAVLEAMACGAPVVCTNVGSLPELVHDGVSGMVVPPNDAVAIRDAFASILTHPDRARRMGSEARRRVLSSFTWPKVVERCLRAYARDSFSASF